MLNLIFFFTKNLIEAFQISTTCFVIEDHLQKILEKSYSKGGTREMREEVKYLLALLGLIFNKIKNNHHYDQYDLFNYYNVKLYKPKSKRKVMDTRQRYFNLENSKEFTSGVYSF